MSGDRETVVTVVAFGDEGLSFEVAFPGDDRQGLAKTVTYQVEYGQEEFGAQAKEIARLVEELAQDVDTGYARQPRLGETEE